MRFGSGVLLAAVLALVGCKGGAPKPIEKKDPASPVSRTKGAGPAWLEDSMARLPGAGTGVPKAGSWSDPNSPGFDPTRESKGLLAGRVLDQYGNGAKNVFIRIEPADAVAKEKDIGAVGILTNEAGFFMVKDLPAGRAYILTAEAKTTDGKSLTGVVQTRPPQVSITIALRDDLGLPPGSENGLPAGASTAGSTSGGSDYISPMALPAPSPIGRVGDGAWAPGAGSAPGAIPATIPGSTLPAPAGVPPPAGVFPTGDPRPGVRPESTAGGDAPPWKPPAVSIPGGPSVPSLPLPPPGSPPTSSVPPPEKRSSRPVKPGANFALVDSLERPWNFAASRSGSLVLLDFMSTNCVHCKRTIPVLTDLQSRYASDGLELIGVLCDDVPQRERAAQAAKYQRDNNLNYAIYVEPGAEAGAIRDRFHVESYPTAVLLNGEGIVLWQGHPAKRAELESAIRKHLGR